MLCFGAGGSGKAISLHFINKLEKGDHPEKIIVTNHSLGRLEKLEAMAGELETDIQIEYVQNADPKVNDSLMKTLPPGSLVINATGICKDTPGLPGKSIIAVN